ncbi:MAG TPA: ATP-binding protein, partial [Burkholderiaceae bacterium]
MNIRVRLMLLVFAVWLPAAVGFGMLARSIFLQETAAGREHVREYGRTLNLLIERELDKRATMARTLGASSSLRQDNLHAFYDEAVAATRGGDSWIILVTPTAEVLNTHIAWRDDLRIPRPASAPMVTTDTSDVFFAPMGPVTRGPVLALFRPQLGISPPRYNIGVAFEPGTIQALVEQQPGPEGALVAVVDDDQLVIARNRDPQRWLGQPAGPEIKRRAAAGLEGFLDSVTLDGVPSLTYMSAPNRYHWQVVVATPKQGLSRSARQLTLQAVGAAAALLIISLALVLYASRRISGPVGALHDAAATLREDRIPPRLATGVREVDDISWVLHDAGVHSQEATRTLEQRVADAVQRAEDAQAKLLEGQKHEAIGRLTGGLAHDFNNLLQTISTALQVFERTKSGPPHPRTLEAAIRATHRAAQLVRQMLTFGRTRPQQLSAVNFTDFLLGARELVQKAIGQGVELVADVEPGLRHLHVDPSQLELALLNLVFNARDAMPDGGRVTVSARNLGDDRAVIAVTDTGMGMDEQTLARATDPYFTTKPVGRGSGLGLAQVRGFALQSGGDVRLRSAPGRGTTVEMYLPTVEAPPAPEAEPAPTHSGRPLRILMVEDDLLVSSVVAPALDAAGHAVTLASTADQAADLLERGASFDVVFTDVVMPGRMSGMDLAAWCGQYRPSTPVVVATGYSAQAMPSVEVLNKPYDLHALLEALDRAA